MERETVDRELTPLERRVLGRLLAGQHPALAKLRAQLPRVEAGRRDSGNWGFATDLRISDPKGEESADSTNAGIGEGETFQVLDVYGRVTGLEPEVGFILFVLNGRLDRLEGQPLDGSWPEDPHLERLYYVHPRIEGGSEMVEVDERDLAWALGSIAGEESTVLEGAPKREERMDENTKVILDPELTQRLPPDILSSKKGREEEKPMTAETNPKPPSPTDAALPVDTSLEDTPERDLTSRRLIYLVSYNVLLGTLLTLGLVFLLPRLPYLTDLSEAATSLASGSVRGHLMGTLLLVTLAGAAGALLANLRDLIRSSGRGTSFPSRLEMPFYLRPLAGAIQGLLIFFLVHLVLSAITMGTLTLSWVTLPGRMIYVALSFAAGFGVDEVMAKLREIARTTFSLRSQG